MHITIRHGSEDVSEKTLDRANAKLTKLSRILDENKFEAIAHMDITRESAAHHSEQLWRASVNIDLAGATYNASEASKTAEKAIDRSINEVKRNILNARSKHLTKIKKDGGIFKRLAQRFN